MRVVSEEAALGINKLLDEGGKALLADKGIRKPPALIYHFTDCGGLIGVLNEKILWATLATSLNDVSEMTYGVDRGRALLGGGVLNVNTLDASLVELLLERKNARPEIGMEWRAYLVSFCEVADTAMHWLHYGRNGTGVAIGCESDRLEETAFVETPTGVKKRIPFELFPVLYEPTEQDALLTKVIEAIDSTLASVLKTVKVATDRNVLEFVAADWTANAIWMAAPRMKDRAFRSEQEWRLLTYEPFGAGVPAQFQIPIKTFYRSVTGRIVPYKKVVYEKLPVNQIILGKSSPMLDDEQALAVLMEESLGARVPVIRSQVTVRP